MKKAAVLSLSLVLGAALLAPRAARAGCDPDTWAELVCVSDAVVTVDVRVDERFERRDITIGQVHMNLTGRKVGRFDSGYLARVVAWVRRKTADADAALEAARQEVAKAKRFRAVVFLEQSESTGGPIELMSHPTYRRWVVLEASPAHAAWWAKIRPMLEERTRLAREGKLPSFCPPTEEPSYEWIEAREKIEAGWVK